MPRPKLSKGERRSKLVGIKVNAEEHDLVHEAALLAAGRPNKASDVFRPVLLRHARRILAEKSKG